MKINYNHDKSPERLEEIGKQLAEDGWVWETMSVFTEEERKLIDEAYERYVARK